MNPTRSDWIRLLLLVGIVALILWGMFQIEAVRVKMWVIEALATIFTLGIITVWFLARLRRRAWGRPTPPSHLYQELKDRYREIHDETIRQADSENPDTLPWLKDGETEDEYWTLLRMLIYSDNQSPDTPQWLQQLVADSESIHQTAMQVLTRLENKTPETLRWLQQRALEDDTEEGCQDAIEILLRKYATVRGRDLLSRDLDGLKPFLDPREPLPQGQIRKAAERWGCAEDEVHVQLKELHNLLGWDPRIGARPEGTAEPGGEVDGD